MTESRVYMFDQLQRAWDDYLVAVDSETTYTGSRKPEPDRNAFIAGFLSAYGKFGDSHGVETIVSKTQDFGNNSDQIESPQPPPPSWEEQVMALRKDIKFIHELLDANGIGLTGEPLVARISDVVGELKTAQAKLKALGEIIPQYL